MHVPDREMLPKAEPAEYVGEVRGRLIKINSEFVFVKFPSSAAQREPRRAPYGLCLPVIGQTGPDGNPAICHVVCSFLLS